MARRGSCRIPSTTFALVAIGAAGVGIAGLYLNAWLTGVVALVLLALISVTAVWLFGRGVWVPITVPALTVGFAFVGDLAWKYFVEGRDKRLIKKLFSRYVSRDVFHQLVANPSLAELGGPCRHMTVLRHHVDGPQRHCGCGLGSAVDNVLRPAMRANFQR